MSKFNTPKSACAIPEARTFELEQGQLTNQNFQKAIFNSSNFISIATDAQGLIQLFNIGAQQMLGYTKDDVVNKLTLAELCDSEIIIAHAKALTEKFNSIIKPDIDALLFKASRSLEDINQLTYICKDGSRLSAMVSVVALYDAKNVNTVTGYLLIGTDNSARKEAEEALLKADALQSAILSSANFSSIATDAKGVIQIFNVGAERMLGYAAIDVINKWTPADISDPQEVVTRAKELSDELGTNIQPGFEAMVFKASRGIEDIYELTYIRKDGCRFPAIVSVTALRDAQETIIGYLLIGTDNSARQEADDKLWQASQYARSLLEASLDPLVTINVYGKITDVNEASIKATGVARDKLIGTDFSNYFTDPEEAREGYREAFSKGSVTDYPLTIRHRNGRLIDVLYNASVYRNEKGKVLGVFAAARDITARKKAEEALVKAGALQSAIFNSANFSSIATDAKGVIQIFNVGAERMLGYTAVDMVDKLTPADISDPQEVIARAAELSEELETPIAPGFEALVFKASRGIEDIYQLTYIRKDGSRFPAVVSVTALRDAENSIIGYLLIGTDNTARIQVEEERKRLTATLQEKNAELELSKTVAEKANRAKSEFLSSMSHELRTPLNAILGFAQLLEKGQPSPTDAQLVRLRQIINAGWYLLELINEILDLAVIESGRLSLSRESVLLIDVMNESRAMVEPQALKREIKLNFLPFDNSWHTKADHTRLKQVLINLLTNAIKYNRQHGTITVQCSEIKEDQTSTERIRINIKDTGNGLSAEQLKQLFQPFNRLGQEDGAEEGTGIGLVVTKQLVELMGGTIGVKSTEGVGCDFWIDLKRDVAPMLIDNNALSTELVPRLSGAGGTCSLLYVEDNSANLMLVQQIINDQPYLQMLSASDGHQGIELARTHRPDVILMDINLPGISGIEALAILKNDPQTAHIPILAISANAMPRDIKKGLKAGFLRYLTKPIKISEFIEALDYALENKRLSDGK